MREKNYKFLLYLMFLNRVHFVIILCTFFTKVDMKLLIT